MLDDYREGSFTPTIIGTTTEGVGTYTTRTGTFTKIGRRVFYDLFVEWSTHDGTGAMRITGLPYTSGNACCTTWHRNLTLAANNVLLANHLIINNLLVISLSQVPIGGGSPQSAVFMDTTGGIMISGTYLTTN